MPVLFPEALTDGINPIQALDSGPMSPPWTGLSLPLHLAQHRISVPGNCSEQQLIQETQIRVLLSKMFLTHSSADCMLYELFILFPSLFDAILDTE